MKNGNNLPRVVIYTDGACTGNPGPGGYGAILKYKDRRKEISAGYRKTTNNRMELMAIIKALSSLKNSCQVILFTDSQYIVDSVTQGWAIRWREKDWQRNKKERALNPDLWEKLLDLFEKHKIEMRWIKGHAGEKENERADLLATQAVKGKHLLIDQYYEKNMQKENIQKQMDL
jgi:ribonuclease HI